MQSLYEKNLFYQQLHFKYITALYLHSTVWKSKHSPRSAFVAVSFVVLYLIDFILGGILLVCVLWNPSIRPQIRNVLSVYTVTLLEWTNEYIAWLMGVPWGIKLNTPLSQFLGTRYLYILDLWRQFYSEFISSYVFLFVDFLLFLLPFGVTLSVTALHDFLKFLNLCLICFFVISSRIFSLQVSALKSFGRLFMGKKWNILRKRVDTCDYDVTQLLVGTTIFTILLFLLPTTGMYLLAFLYLRFIQFSVQFALRVCAVTVNKLTVSTLSFLNASLQPQPISKATIRISGLAPIEYARKKVIPPYKVVDGKDSRLECFSVDNDDITVLWNGKVYSVDEMREIVQGIPESVLIKEQQPFSSGSGGGSGGDSIEAVVQRHSMIHWFWTLPNN